MACDSPHRSLPSKANRRSGAGRSAPHVGFTLVELMIAVAVVMVLTTISTIAYGRYVDRARAAAAASDIGDIQAAIERVMATRTNGTLPSSLADVGMDQKRDPWGRAYVYLNLLNGGPHALNNARKDRNLHPLNTDYDLYSIGKDGETAKPLTAAISQDDVIRANNGAFVGLAQGLLRHRQGRMRLDRSAFNTKVARRVFTLFMVSALLPIGALSVGSYFFLVAQLDAQVAEQVRRDAKSFGMDLLGRLDLLRISLADAASHLAGDGVGSPRTLADEGQLLGSVGIAKERDEVARLLGPDADLGSARLAPGIPWVWLGAAGEAPAGHRLRMVLATPGLGYVVGKPDETFLWGPGSVDGIALWVVDRTGRTLFESRAAAPFGRPPTEQAVAQQSGTFVRTLQGEDWQVGFWTAFLGARYEAPDWTVVLARPAGSLRAEVTQLKYLLLLAAGLGILLAGLLSVVQIRRSLQPVVELKAAAAKVAARDFGTSVAVRSGDEFEELAASFNAMTAELDRQFQTQATMAAIDRAILAVLDPVHIVAILVNSVGKFVPYDVLGVGLVEAGSPRRLWQLIRLASEGEADVAEVVSEITEEDLAALAERAELRLDTTQGSLPAYLLPLAARGAGTVLVFPVHGEGSPAALICLGFRGTAAADATSSKLLVDLADRSAVAFSNAALNARLYHQAHYDPLTGLPNRLMLRDRLAQALARARRDGTRVGVILLDLDNFKRVNDTLGHHEGDRLLVKVSKALSRSLRDADSLIRMGGDEFTVVVPDLPGGEAGYAVVTGIAARLRAALDRPLRLRSEEVTIGASMGIAVSPDDGEAIDDLLQHADLAMYSAKASDRGGFHFYSRQMRDAALADTRMEAELKKALAGGQFLLHYQPKVSTHDQRLLGVEALLRWLRPGKGLVPPGAFIAHAEHSGLIVPIGDWVLGAACRQIVAWQEQGLAAVPIAINISARQFAQRDLARTIEATLSRYGVAPSLIEIEITEATAIESPASGIRLLEELRDLGVRIAIDDFGTGYSSLSYLKRLPVDVLKIDRSFVTGLPEDRESVAITRAIVGMAHSLEIEVVAEGVETEAQRAFLASIGCDLIQGYLIARPTDAEELGGWLETAETSRRQVAH